MTVFITVVSIVQCPDYIDEFHQLPSYIAVL